MLEQVITQQPPSSTMPASLYRWLCMSILLPVFHQQPR